jgi:hypothetical protein
MTACALLRDAIQSYTPELVDSTESTVHKGPSVLEIHCTGGSSNSVSPAEIPHPTRLTLFVTYSGDDVSYRVYPVPASKIPSISGDTASPRANQLARSGSHNVFSGTSRAQSRVSANCLQESLIFKFLSARTISVCTRAMERQPSIVQPATFGEQSQSSSSRRTYWPGTRSVFILIVCQEFSKMQSRSHIVCL